ncbi:tyrosine-protein phosphatase [Desulfotalea psychrophila]|uniref:Related to protein-tyrosine phosphatase n=1 Tax=Desulfotalea psychrophila (strain LSv54 / DSM 12343) TaxID=177439 RepID=Q6AJA3_DESPS|nr:tyrosine-protein phosphatase [Desulfotalea psychrophila]CAG37577.1 related to protein-tyrosine phosphatase [Desulfotalea psychrophila LSv54]
MCRATKRRFIVGSILFACLSNSPAWAENEISTPLLPTANNFRDIAGISETHGGNGFVNDTRYKGLMRTGVFYRSSKLQELNSKDFNTISALGISLVIDLRSPYEISLAPDLPLPGASLVNHNIYAINPPVSPPIPGDSPPLIDSTTEMTKYFHDFYRKFITDYKQRAEFKLVLLDLINTPGAGLYHCTGGKDRTGWVSVILQSIAGVSDSTIMKDYLATNLYSEKYINEFLVKITDPNKKIAYRILAGVQEDFLQAALDQVVTSYGSMQAYLTQGLGLSQADIYLLRAKMVYYQTLPGQAQFSGNAARGATFLNALQNSPLSGQYSNYNYYLQAAIDAGTLAGVETRVGGQVHADAAAYLLRQPQLIDNALTTLASGQNLKFGEGKAWLSGVTENQEVSSRSGIASSDSRSSGLIVGGTHRFNENASAYVGASYISNKVESASADADIDNYLVVFGGRYALAKLETGPYMGVRFSAGALDYKSTRPLDYGLGTATGKTDGKTYSGRIDLGNIFDRGTFTITPQLGLLVAHINLDRFDEQGSELGLHVNGISETIPSLLAELRVDLNGRQFGNWLFQPSAVVGYERALDTSNVTSTGSLYGYPISQESAYDSRDLAKLGLGVSARNGNFSLQVGANVMAGENINSILGANINFSYTF